MVKHKTRKHFPEQRFTRPTPVRVVPEPVEEEEWEEEEDDLEDELEEEDLEDETDQGEEEEEEDDLEEEEEDFDEEEEEVERPVQPTPRRRVRPINAYQLPYGMDPAPPAEEKHSPVMDLGSINRAYKGWKVVFNLSVDLGVQSLLEVVSDPKATPRERMSAAREWLRSSILAWNFTRKNASGEVEQLPQPSKGGIDRLVLEEDIFRALMLSFKRAYRPSKNALRR